MKPIPVIDETQTDFFMKAIPRWLTHYGFAGVVTLLVILMLAASFFRYPKKIPVRIYLTHKQVTARVDFATFEQVTEGMECLIHTPFLEKKITAHCLKKGAWAEDQFIYVPLSVTDSVLYQLPFKKALLLNGQLSLPRHTLANRLWSVQGK